MDIPDSSITSMADTFLWRFPSFEFAAQPIPLLFVNVTGFLIAMDEI